MQLLTLEKKQTTQLFWLVLGILVAVMLFTGKQQDPAVVATALVLAITAVYPLYFWLLGWSHGLPIWPVFALVNGTFAALPMVQDPETLDAYTSGEIITGGMTLVGFIVLGTAVWLSLTGRKPSAPKTVLMVSREHSDRYLFAFIAAGLFFQLNFLFWWINLPGNMLSVVRGVTLSLNTLGIFVLAFYAGRKVLSRPAEVLLICLTAGTALAAAATLIMASAIVPVAMILLGYALGSGKIPWKGIIAVFVFAAVLHPGKFAMREIYWQSERPQLTLLGLPQYFGDWFAFGLQEVGFAKPDARESKPETTNLFERAGNVHMLLLVQKKSPDEVPFLNGLTYEPIPRLLIPRILDDQKGISHAGNVLLTVNYGVQTIEQTQTTSIYWGLIPEAYANFGYIGVAGLAVVLGLFYGYVTNLTVGVPLTSLRFVLGLLIMGAATKADTMGVFVTSQFQGIVGVSLAALVLMRRQGNPFAAEAANGGLQDYGTTGQGGIRHKANGKWGRKGMEHGAWSMEQAASEGNSMRHEVDGGAKQLAADGGVVRTMPVRTPQRIARWMPRRVRAAVVAQQQTAADNGTTGLQDDGAEGRLKDEEAKRQPSLRDGLPSNQLIRDRRERPRQVAVPYQNYRRYRSG